MSVASGVSVSEECHEAFSDFRKSGGSKGAKTKYIIFKISDNKKQVVVEEVSQEQDYEVFREKLTSAVDSLGRPVPRYAVYDVEYELGAGEGKRNKLVFISWVPQETSAIWSMIYASTRQGLKSALNVSIDIHADEKSDLEWKSVLLKASDGKAGK